MFCHYCGTQVGAGGQFCPSCGQSVDVAGALRPVTPSYWIPRTGIQAQTGRWLGAGWQLVKNDLGNYVLMALVFTILSGVPFIQGALLAGFHIFTMRKLNGRRAEFADLFKGFSFFLPTLVASLVIALFVFLGTLACLIPGLVLAAAYKFTYLFIVDKRMDFWPAMKASHAVVRQDYFGFTIFLLAAAGVNLLGVLCCVVGMFVTIPLTIAAVTVAYQETVGFEPETLAAL